LLVESTSHLAVTCLDNGVEKRTFIGESEGGRKRSHLKGWEGEFLGPVSARKTGRGSGQFPSVRKKPQQ